LPRDNRWLVAIFRINKDIAATTAGISILVRVSICAGGGIQPLPAAMVNLKSNDYPAFIVPKEVALIWC
jgi:hypothetical protein